MNIQAHCRLDRQSVKALTHVSVYKKHNPNTRLAVRLCLVGVFAFIAVVGFFLNNESSLVLLCLALLLLFLTCSVHFLLPKTQYKALANMRDVNNDYTFGDETLKVSTNADDYHGESEIRYAILTKVYETDAHFFLCQTTNQVFIVDKGTLSDGDEDRIRAKLRNTISGKYIRCRY